MVMTLKSTLWAEDQALPQLQAPQTAVTAGSNVIIQGAVMDISAGTQQAEQKADFPNGVPVSSDASMAAWMGYVYQQQPEPTNFTGVSVQLAAIDRTAITSS